VFLEFRPTVYMPCPKCGRLGPIEPPHKDPSVGEEIIEFKCPANSAHKWEQQRRIPGLDVQRECLMGRQTPRGCRETPPRTKADIIRLHSEGVYISEICKNIHVSGRTIYRVLNEAGAVYKKLGRGRPRKTIPTDSFVSSPSV
jgi:hypothetical protein